MPSEILRLQERAASADCLPRHQAIRNRVSSIMPLYQLSRYRPTRPPRQLFIKSVGDGASDEPAGRPATRPQPRGAPANRPVGDPGLEPGTSSLSGKRRVASSRANSQLLPANGSNGGHGRRLETTGRKLVAHRGPTAAERGQGVVWPRSGHHADDKVTPGRWGGGLLRACRIASTAASLGASSSSSITWP